MEKETFIERFISALNEEIHEAGYQSVTLATEYIHDNVCSFLGDYLYESRFTKPEVKLYRDFNDFSVNELNYVDFNCRNRKVQRHIVDKTGITNGSLTSNVCDGVQKHTLVGDVNTVGIIIYYNVDSSNIDFFREVVAIYVPEVLILDYKKPAGRFMKFVD